MKALTTPCSMALYVSHKLRGKGAMRLTVQCRGLLTPLLTKLG